MAKLVTLADLRTRCLGRADMENSSFVGTTQLNSFINKSASQLYDLLVAAYEEYFMSVASGLTVSSGTPAINLPSDFYKLLGVDEVVDSTQSVSIKPYMLGERNSYTSPTSARSVNLLYIPCRADLVADGDTFDSVNDWDEYIVACVARKMLLKEESDVSELNAEILDMRRTLEAMAGGRDAGQPQRATDIHQVDPWAHIAPPTRLRYRLRGSQIHFVECYAFTGNP